LLDFTGGLGVFPWWLALVAPGGVQAYEIGRFPVTVHVTSTKLAPRGIELAPVEAVVVGGDRLFAEVLSAALQSRGFESRPAIGAREAVEVVKSSLPRVVLLAVGDPSESNLRLGTEILRQSPSSKLVMVTTGRDPDAAAAVMRAGFHGCVTVGTPLRKVIFALRAALEGEFVLPHGLAQPATTGLNAEEVYAAELAKQLTGREWEVLALLAEGGSNREIARRLSISPNTVRAHVQGILAKLEVNNRLEAVTFAVRNHLVEIPDSRSSPEMNALEAKGAG
jgi:NarL family two-component system response regulator LiaR